MKSMNHTYRSAASPAVAGLAVLLTVAAGNASAAAVTNFVSIDVPGSIDTIANDVNGFGVVVGRFEDGAGIHGFVLDHGTYSTVDYPGAAATVALGINDWGQVVGRFRQGGADHGFLLDNGVFTEIDYPGAHDTLCHGIDRYGQIVGRHLDNAGGAQGIASGLTHEHGFSLSNGVFSNVEYPGSGTTDAWKITDAGDVVGDWSSEPYPNAENGFVHSRAVHGYVLHNGQFSSVDYPGTLLTASRDMNASGAMVGIYVGKTLVDHGFVRVDGVYSGFDFPGASSTDGNAINDDGVIVGSYVDSNGVEHGYVAGIDTP